MKNLFLKIVILFFLTLFVNCGDNLNTNNSVGNDTFSCRINGKLYIPSAETVINGGDIRPFSWTYTNLDNPENSYYFNISSLGSYRLELYIVRPILGENLINQKLNNTSDFTHSGMILLDEDILYNTLDNQINGFVTFTEFSETRAIGTLECILYNENGDKIKITEDKFNLSLDSRTN